MGAALLDSDLPKFVKTTYYGPEKSHHDLTILLQHANRDYDSLFQKLPELPNLFIDDLDAVKTFADIVHDFGTYEVGHGIGKIIGTQSDIRVAVIEILLPRGILDPNRMPQNFFNLVFDETKLTPEIKAKLLAIHGEITSEVQRVISQSIGTNPDGTGPVLDVHSMRPFDLADLPNNEELSLSEREYDLKRVENEINHRLSPRYRTRLRPEIDVITGSPEFEPTLHNLLLEQSMVAAAKKAGITWAFNDPYGTGPIIQSRHYLNNYRGIGIDISKSALSSQKYIPHLDYPLDYLDIDPQKVEALCTAFATSIISALTQKQENPPQKILTV